MLEMIRTFAEGPNPELKLSPSLSPLERFMAHEIAGVRACVRVCVVYEC